MKPFLHELEGVQVNNVLYKNWIEYALTLTRADIIDIINKGMTYQANALKSMVREIIANSKVPTSLIKKIDVIASKTAQKANTLR